MNHRGSRQKLALVAFHALLLCACDELAFERFQGQTMGTYYSVQYQPVGKCRVMQAEIEATLAAVNASMSTYQVDSEISRLNRHPASQWVALSAELAEVLRTAAELWQRSGGAFDVTVGPLVNLWGFGPSSGLLDVREGPGADAQVRAAARVGMEKLTLDGSRLMKTVPGLYVDLSALAKGYAVDRIAGILTRHECVNFMVDIGGEIQVAGVNAKSDLWRIGVEVPAAHQLGTLQTVVSFSNLSIATSGDYRNYRMIDGVRVDHVLDPRSGKPAANDVVSATVIHPSAMWADAYATTLMVLGMEAGMAFADSQGVAAYMMSRRASEDDNSPSEEMIEARYNAAMRKFLPR